MSLILIKMANHSLILYSGADWITIDYSRGTSAHAHEALRIHLHKLCTYKLYLCHHGVEETNNFERVHGIECQKRNSAKVIQL